MRQGLVSLALHVAGLWSVVMASFLLAAPLGFAMLGLSCFTLEYLTREDHP